MDTQEILFELEQVKEKEKDKKYFTGELNIYAMLCDVISFINQQDNDIQRLTQSIKTVGNRYRTLDRKYTKLRKGNYYLKNERDNVLENNKYLREYIKTHEHSELVDKLNEMERTINSLDYELNDIYHPQPYKFKDLEKGIWIWDITWNLPRQIRYIKKDTKEIQFYDCDYREKFEYGYFYPLTKATQYKEKEVKDDD